MPMWHIYAPDGAFTAQQKKDISEAITSIYVDFTELPRFYVVVLFKGYAEESMWVGGECKNDLVRIYVDHIARQMDDAVIRAGCMEVIDQRVVPHFKECGLTWEIHIDETPTDLWRVQSIVPPPPYSEAEKQWARENAASEYEIAEEVMAPIRAAREMLAAFDSAKEQTRAQAADLESASGGGTT